MSLRRTSVSLLLIGSLSLSCAESRSVAQRPSPEAAFRARLGQRWELTRLGAREIPGPPEGTLPDTPGKDLVPGRRPTIRFSATEPGVGGRTFCNSYGGPFEVRGDSLRIGQIISTAVGCDKADSLETLFHRGLRETRRFEIDSLTLVLITADGTRLVFTPADSSTTYP